MTLQAVIARPLMAFATALTPASRAEWSLAMRQEFEALPDGQGALAWAAGCLANALGWRMRAEAPFGFSFILIILTGSWIFAPMIFDRLYPIYGSPDWIMPVANANHALRAFACFLLAVAWPRRAVFAGLLAPMLWQDGVIPKFFLTILEPAFSNPWVRPSNHPDTLTVVFALQFLFDEMWPCVLAAALGWGIRQVWLARRTAVA